MENTSCVTMAPTDVWRLIAAAGTIWKCADLRTVCISCRPAIFNVRAFQNKQQLKMSDEAAPSGGTSGFGHPDFRLSLTEADSEIAGPIVTDVCLVVLICTSKWINFTQFTLACTMQRTVISLQLKVSDWTCFFFRLPEYSQFTLPVGKSAQ